MALFCLVNSVMKRRLLSGSDKMLYVVLYIIYYHFLLNLSVCPSVHLSVCSLVCPSVMSVWYVHLSVGRSVALSVCPSVSLSICLSICLSVSRLLSPSIHLSVCLSVCQLVDCSVCLSVCPFVSLLVITSALCSSVDLPIYPPLPSSPPPVLYLLVNEFSGVQEKV